VNDRLRERLLAVASAVGYPLFYVTLFIVFSAWTFPLDKVKDRIVTTFNEGQRTSTSPRELAIADISSSWVTGLELTGVRLVSHDAPKDSGRFDTARADTVSEIKVDSVVARLQVLPLLIGHHNVKFHADLFSGKLDGSLKEAGKDQSLDVSMEGLDLGQFTPLTQILDVPVEGSLAGTLSFDIPDGHISKANGSLALEVSDMAVGDGKAKLMGKVAAPRLNLGVFALTADIKDGTMKISKLGASGKDVDFLADGRIPLRETVTDSSLDLNLRFRVSDAYRAKNDTTKALFGAPDSTVPGVLDLDPKMKQAKRADGFYTWHARGQLGRPDFSPGGTGGPTTGPGGSASPAATPGKSKAGP
jgi:type II secretion system protein N